jgi:multiple sugar transport system permease protein/putative aldouronate transport system permease protein
MPISQKNNITRDTANDRIFMIIIYIFLSFYLIAVLYPLIYIVSASFSSPAAVNAGRVWLWPVKPTLVAYNAVFENHKIWSGFLNSLFYMIAGTILNLIMTMLAAFPLSRKEFVGKEIFTIIFVFTMYFSGGLVPLYLLICRLGLVDKRLVMILPFAMSVWNMIICRTFLQNTIPDELFQAAELDGCSEGRFLFCIVLPLSKPVLAVLALYYGVYHWNSYFYAMIFLSSPRLYPLQLVLREILVLGKIDTSTIATTMEAKLLEEQQGLAALLKYAVIVVASVPVMCIYPFVQKYFVKGIMIGSLKG